MNQQLTLIKLGGSVITNKEVPMMVREENLSRLVREIALAQAETGQKYLVGHGQGSFAHAPAMQYQTKEGFIREDSVFGMAVTQDSALQLNRIVVREFLSAHLPAISYCYSNTLVTENQQAASWNAEVLRQYLHKGLLPVTGGDVIVDTSRGCTIWSTEKVLGHIAVELPKFSDFKISKIIHVTEVPGVMDKNGRVIREISENNLDEVRSAIAATRGFDVTGGMGHKIEESLLQAKNGIEVMIISGLQPKNLYNCLVGQEFVGTLVSSIEGASSFASYKYKKANGLIS